MSAIHSWPCEKRSNTRTSIRNNQGLRPQRAQPRPQVSMRACALALAAPARLCARAAQESLRLQLARAYRGWAVFPLVLSCVVLALLESEAKLKHSDRSLAASLVAAGLSGFAGVYLELMFTRGSTTIWMRNVQLAIFTLPLQTLTVYQTDRAHIAAHGALHGFWPSTWAVVAIQVAGGLIVAIVIKYAGNILKTFAAVLSR